MAMKYPDNNKTIKDTTQPLNDYITRFEQINICENIKVSRSEDAGSSTSHVLSSYADKERNESCDSGGVDTIAWSTEDICTRVYVKHTKDKGRCLFSKVDMEPGEVIYVEKATFVAIPQVYPSLWHDLNGIHDDSPLDLPPTWHFAALCSLFLLNKTDKNIIRDKWIPSTPIPSQDVLRVVKSLGASIDPIEYERFLLCWRYNSFGHHTETDGLVLYNWTSMMSHSCVSTCCWHYCEGDYYVLRARGRVKSGMELSISYIADEDLFKSSDVRRLRLSGWCFTCNCSRCVSQSEPAREFRCQVCGVGCHEFKTTHTYTHTQTEDETSEAHTVVTTCSTCMSEPTDEEVSHFIELESLYRDRLLECEKNDLPDLECVYAEAVKVFCTHWIIFALESMMFEAFKDQGRHAEALYMSGRRTHFLRTTCPLPTYTLAWSLEEHGDVAAGLCGIDASYTLTTNSLFTSHYKNIMVRSYDEAACYMKILCGVDHDYTRSARDKHTNCSVAVAVGDNH
eukprot:GHVR01092899.1.p1 GENE.GHVR01092899.1~~GHVR01092899.1.p1  ORF type:complete len:510 (-),score=103.76 GHVR01092899.1:263-1792(-)